MTISIIIIISKGNQEYQILINSNLNFNIIHQSLIKKWRINSVKRLQRYPSIINKEKLFNYDIHNFKMHIYDYNKQMNIYYRFFYTAEILEIDIILNYLWLHTVNSEID